MGELAPGVSAALVREGQPSCGSLPGNPFEIGDDWFEIVLPSLELVMTEGCPAEFRERAGTMLTRLRLGKSEDVIVYRHEWYRMYKDGELTLDGPERKAFLIARAVRRDQTRRHEQ